MQWRGDVTSAATDAIKPVIVLTVDVTIAMEMGEENHLQDIIMNIVVDPVPHQPGTEDEACYRVPIHHPKEEGDQPVKSHHTMI
jgi:hypothetical protein